jgi:hypothetical protein
MTLNGAVPVCDAGAATSSTRAVRAAGRTTSQLPPAIGSEPVSNNTKPATRPMRRLVSSAEEMPPAARRRHDGSAATVLVGVGQGDPVPGAGGPASRLLVPRGSQRQPSRMPRSTRVRCRREVGAAVRSPGASVPGRLPRSARWELVRRSPAIRAARSPWLRGSQLRTRRSPAGHGPRLRNRSPVIRSPAET